MKMRNLDERMSEYLTAVKRNDNDITALTGLARLHLLLNDVEKAISYFQSVIELEPHQKEVHSDLLMCTNYLSTFSNQDYFSIHQQWAKVHGTTISGHVAQDSDLSGKLKVGLLSGDFNHHVVPNFLFPWLENANRNNLEFYAFSEAKKKDATTLRLSVHFMEWFDTHNISDEEVANQIKDIGVHILIDLSGHTKGNRLSVMARRAAPVQVSYLGYVNTTGLPQVDYRIIDRYVNPPKSQQFYSEHLAYLPGSYTCFAPPKTAPAVGPLPFNENGYITFGCFNNANKITEEVVKLWSEILRKLPNSRLKLKAKNFDHPGTSRLLESWFSSQDIDLDRIVFEGSSDYPDYFDAYNSIDIALDPFPHNGGTVTHDSLYMGVPVITLEGENYVGRMGVSILNHLGHPEWITQSGVNYVTKAVELAEDEETLGLIRNQLRQRMLDSPLCDGPAFATSMETLLFEIWNKNQPNQK